MINLRKLAVGLTLALLLPFLSGAVLVDPYLFAVSGGSNISVDFWQKFSSATLSTGNLATDDTGTVTGGTYTITGTAFSTSTSGQQAFTGTINSATDSDSPGRGLARDMTLTDAETIDYLFPTTLGTNPNVWGFMYKTATTYPAESVCQIFHVGGPGDYVCRVAVYNNGFTTVFRFRGNGSWADVSVPLVANTWYRISVVAQGSGTANGCILKIYTVSSNVQLGTTLTTTAADTTAAGFSIGNGGVAHGAGTGTAYYDNVIIKTNSTTELGP